jgi:hypothetical protein
MDIDKMMSKALRRCGIAPETLTPEISDSLRESLFMFLVSLSNEGLNLWCVEQNLLPVFSGKKTYDTPIGTTDVLNLLFCVPSLVAVDSFSSNVTSKTAVLAANASIVRYAFRLDSVPTQPILVEYSTDGISWNNLKTVQAANLEPTGFYNWFEVDPVISVLQFRVSSTSAITVNNILLASSAREVPMSAFNRDDYSALPNKESQSSVSLNFFFEKLIAPRISLWPVPNEDTNYLKLFRYRQIQDIGDLTNEIEIPTRWLEAVNWQLALRASFEVPNVDPARRKEIGEMADRFTLTAGSSEVDGSPVFIAPNIRGYTGG